MVACSFFRQYLRVGLGLLVNAYRCLHVVLCMIIGACMFLLVHMLVLAFYCLQIDVNVLVLLCLLFLGVLICVCILVHVCLCVCGIRMSYR